MQCQAVHLRKKLTIYFLPLYGSTKNHRHGYLKKINRGILSKENNDTDSTDGIFDFLSQISNSVQEGFDELLGGDSGKKRFVKAMSKIFTLLFKTRVDTAEKIKRIIKIAIETTLKILQEPRQQEGDYLW